MLYGSWPVEHAADQIVSCCVPARFFKKSGIILFKVSKGVLSLKKLVSCVIMAFMTSFSSGLPAAVRMRSMRVSRLASLRCLTIGKRRATTRYCLLSSMTTPVFFLSKPRR